MFARAMYVLLLLLYKSAEGCTDIFNKLWVRIYVYVLRLKLLCLR
jgi:hypothetical protein